MAPDRTVPLGPYRDVKTALHVTEGNEAVLAIIEANVQKARNRVLDHLAGDGEGKPVLFPIDGFFGRIEDDARAAHRGEYTL